MYLNFSNCLNMIMFYIELGLILLLYGFITLYFRVLFLVKLIIDECEVIVIDLYEFKEHD